MFATSLQRWFYCHAAKPIFFSKDPESVHNAMTRLGAALGRRTLTRLVSRLIFSYQHPALVQKILGIHFPNPIGLAAGFDKNAELVDIIPAVGFGFMEIGSVTGEPCDGNPKPRLWRLPKSRGLVVWYGLKNNGCEEVAKRLLDRFFEIPLGTSIARTNTASTVNRDAGITDYAKAFRAFANIGDYTTVNISCPNTCGGEPFVAPECLDQLLDVLDEIKTEKPIFLKLPVDISKDDLEGLVKVSDKHRVHGFIVSNLTKQHDRHTIAQEEIQPWMKGGISGRPTFDPSNQLISYLYQMVGTRYVIIGSGGVFSAEDAYEKIRRGASLVQLATGMIFEGPQLIGEINRGLVRLLKRDGYHRINEVIGSL